MSYAFEFCFYAAAIVATLAIYGSTLPRKAPATVPAPAPEAPAPTPEPSADVTLADFALLCPDSPALDEEVLSFIDELLTPAPVPTMEDAIVPFRRKRPTFDGLESLGVRALRAIASELKISKYSRKSKAQLITEIREARAVQAA